MCGRFTLTSDIEKVAVRFAAEPLNVDWHPRYNIAPGQSSLVIMQEEMHRALTEMRFGLIPHWSKEKKTGYSMINARAETLTQKPSFKKPFRNQRCLIPADGYYEWQEKQPYRITLKNREIFAFAGLWDVWKDEKGNPLYSFSIITTAANALTRKLHDRMPVLLKREDESVWLDDEGNHEELLKPYASGEMDIHPASPLVNTWKNDSPECLLP